MKIKSSSGLLTVAVASIGIAYAQDAPPFEEVDTDADGELSRIEVATIEAVEFQAADKNQDGRLDRTEYESAIGSP
jgi:hypothetical protein